MDFKPSLALSRTDYTTGQKEGINKILDWSITSDTEPFVLAGFAGTGKTTMIKDIIRNLVGSIACTAPTHRAVRVISEALKLDGKTIQKLLGLRPNTDLENFNINNPQFDPLAAPTLGNYKYLFIDECSMLNKHITGLIIKLAKKYGTKVIFVGDPYQLPPPKEKHSVAFDVKNKHYLSEIVRQEDGNPLIKVLSMARDAVKYRNDTLINFLYKYPVNISDIGFAVYKPHDFAKVVSDKFDSIDFERNIDYCRYTAYTNNAISSLNNYVRKLLFGEQQDPVIHDDLFTSYSTILNEFNEQIIINSEDYIIHDIMNYNNKYLLEGFLVRLRKINGGDITENLFILNHYNQQNLHNYIEVFTTLLKEAHNAPIGSSRRSDAWASFYRFKNYNLLLTNVDSETGVRITTKDIDYGFGLTVHKTQGCTFDNILVNAKDIIYNYKGIPYTDKNLRNRLFYVALSRARHGAYIVL